MRSVSVSKAESFRFAQELSAAGDRTGPMRSRVTFRTLAGEWDASVLPMYKHSTQVHRRFMLKKHLLPRSGDKEISDVTRQEIQAYVAQLTQAGYVDLLSRQAPHGPLRVASEPQASS